MDPQPKVFQAGFRTSMKEINSMAEIHGILFDVDGTLLDSNDAHAHAWVEAMAQHGHNIPFEKVRPLIGMGGDKVLPETLGIAKDSEEGKQISQARKQIYLTKYLPHIKPFPRTMELLQRLHNAGMKLVIATSAEQDELQKMMQVIDPHAADLFEEAASSKDAKQSKPDPDVMNAALKLSGLPAEQVLMIGDTIYDIESAAKAGIKTIAFRCGGWQDADLKGAIAIYDGPADLLQHYDTSPLAGQTKVNS